jgi:hypothetical protein
MASLAASNLQILGGRVLVFIPSFNDSAALPGLVSEVGRLGRRYQALVIDDGSSRSVLSEVLAKQCLHVRLSSNFGLGVCTHIAFHHALTHGYFAVVRIDADGQHQVSDIIQLVAALDSGDLDLVAGVRVNQDRDHVAFGRRIVKTYFNGFAQWITQGCAPQDVNTGFIAANAAAVATLNLATLERFPEPEIFVSACNSGLRVGSIEIEQRDRIEGRSTIHFIGGLKMLFRFNVFVFGQLMRKLLP